MLKNFGKKSIPTCFHEEIILVEESILSKAMLPFKLPQ